MLEIIGAIARQPRHFIGEVHVSGFFKLLYLMLGSDFIEKNLEHIIGEDIVSDAFNVTANADGRLLSGYQMKVGCLVIVHQLKKSVDFCHEPLP